MLFIGDDRKIHKFCQDGKHSVASGTRPPPVNRPGHCGVDMQLTMQSSAAAGDALSSSLDGSVRDLHLVWQCRCGFRLGPQGDPRKKCGRPLLQLKPVSGRWIMPSFSCTRLFEQRRPGVWRMNCSRSGLRCPLVNLRQSSPANRNKSR